MSGRGGLDELLVTLMDCLDDSVIVAFVNGLLTVFVALLTAPSIRSR